ncbi:MAG TPA: TonB-dependent receptor [Prolixibacteraceae bacterium]|nr:TonB-dependent receptor [Prolixibacteraceae bacterium]
MNKHFLCVVFLFFLFRVSGQEISSVQLDQRYSQIPFKEFVSKLQANYQIRMLYDDKWIDSLVTPTIDNTVLLSNFLSQMLQPLDLHYVEYQGNVVVMPGRQQVAMTNNEERYSIVGNPLFKGKFKKATVKGLVLDGKTETPIPGASIFCEALSKVTTSDKDGKFSMELPVGENSLKISFIGLNDEVKELLVYSDGEIKIELFEKYTSLGQVTIMADRPEDNYRSTSMGAVKLSAKSIKKLSVLMGEADIIKSMVMLPGVQSTGENASGFNVRGGNIDQNLILIQDAPVYNTSHLFGLFSMLDPGIIDDVTLYKSGIPSKYGGRISSVMDIDLKRGESSKIKVNGGIGLINGRLSVEGPIIKDKLTFTTGFRTTYSDWILKLVKNYQVQQSSVRFYDLNAKLDYTINPKNRLSVFGYGSSDYFNYYEEAEYGYGNQIGSARWNHIFNRSTTGSLSLNFSRFNSDLVDYSTKNYEYDLNTSIEQEQLAYNFSTNFIPRHKITAGFNAIRYVTEPGNSKPHSDNSAASFINIDNEHSFESALYVEDEFELVQKLALIAGLRYSGFAKVGAAVVNTYYDGSPLSENTVSGSKTYGSGEIIKLYQGVEPRIALRYEFGNSSSVKLGYNRTRQYIRQVSNSTSITPADYWKAADPFLKPLIADQLAVGFFKNFKDNQYETSLEIYYKDVQNEVDFKNGGRIILNKNIEQVLIPGIGKAYGAELMIKKSKGDLTGWLAYTYSRSFKKIDGAFAEEKINGGDWYPSNYDKPHDLTVVINYKLSRRFTFSSNFTYSTGRPVTLPESKYYIGGYEIVSYSDRNKYRLPDYHRLDMALTYEGSLLKHQKWRSSWTISLYNVYGRKNPFSVYYSKETPSRLNDYKTYALYQFSVIGVPIPSFTYNFWF